MTTLLRLIHCATLLAWTCAAQVAALPSTTESDAGKVLVPAGAPLPAGKPAGGTATEKDPRWKGERVGG